jgi:UDP-N-acetyl-D-mannosaminuronic acid dehydrogenase
LLRSLCILGLGYIGLPTSAMFANNGLLVTGVDINVAIIDHLNHKQVHIEEPGLYELVS